MAQGNGATRDIAQIGVQAQQLLVYERHDTEGLVEFKEADVLDLQACSFQSDGDRE